MKFFNQLSVYWLGLISVIAQSCSTPHPFRDARAKDNSNSATTKSAPNEIGVGGQLELKGAYSLEQRLETALEQNKKRPASKASVAIAEAQHQQALASFWPQVSLNAAANLRSVDPHFVFPGQEFLLPNTIVDVSAQEFSYPASTFSTPATSITTPASSMSLPLGPGGSLVTVPIAPQTISVPSQDISVPSQKINVPGQEFQVTAQTFNLESQDIKVMDRRTVGGQLNAEWLLWNAGWRKALKDQSKAGIAAAKEDARRTDARRTDARRTDLEIIYDVRRMYWASVMATSLEKIGKDTLERMEATLKLTETFYKGGSMKVNKSDYLRNKVLVEGLRSMVDKLEENRRMANSALGNSMGLSWKSDIRPKDGSLSFHPVQASEDQLVAEVYEFSPDWKKLQIGLDAAEARIREEKAGHMPKVAFLGNIHRAETPFEGGYATDANLNAWNVGIGVELPLFDGFLTKARVTEARARMDELKQKRALLREGLALQVKINLIQLNSMKRQDQNNRSAQSTAMENRELTEKAYRNNLIEADTVFSAQIVESISKARAQKLRFDHSVSQSKLDLLVRRDILGQLGLL